MPHSNHRIGFKFWFNLDKPDESALADTIELLKNKRSFTSVIRDGIRLVCNLRDGKLDVLFDLFPWVRAEFLQYMREVTIEAPSGQYVKEPLPNQHIEAERAWLEAEQERLEQERAWQERRLAEAQQALEAERRNIEQERQRIEVERTEHQTSIQKQLARMEALLLSQGHQPIERPIEQRSHHPNEVNQAENRPSGLKQLVVPQFTVPPIAHDDDEEDLLEVKKDESAAMRTTQNFLRSVISLNDETKQPPKTNTTYSTSGKRRYNREVEQQ